MDLVGLFIDDLVFTLELSFEEKTLEDILGGLDSAVAVECVIIEVSIVDPVPILPDNFSFAGFLASDETPFVNITGFFEFVNTLSMGFEPLDVPCVLIPVRIGYPSGDNDTIDELPFDFNPPPLQI